MLSMLIFAAASAPQPQVMVLPNNLKAMAPICDYADKGVQTVGGKPDAPVHAQRLNELPNANEYLAVIRRDADGCNKPAVVAYDIGSVPKKQR
jgi:hypothetical protein